DRLAHRLPRDPQLANDPADRLFIDPERPPDPANRFHRHHPRPRSPKHNQGEHLTIPGVGRYWMLITPRAGSLFHAVFHCHSLPFDRSALTHWRQRLGEEQLAALIQESLSVAHKTGALASRDLERVVVDTTVQPKAIAHPTDARLCHRVLEKLVDL